MSARLHSDANPGRLSVAGTLDFDSVPTLLADITQALPRTGSAVLDLAGVTGANSAALALLVAVQREAGIRGLDLGIEHLPTELATIAHVSGLDGILPLAQ